MEWRERGWFLAMDRDIACGIAGSFLDENDPTRAYLISMWTAPTHRQRGIGRLLVKEVLNWARSRNARILQLMVTSHNEPAICLDRKSTRLNSSHGYISYAVFCLKK